MIHYLSVAFGSKLFYNFQKIKHSIFNLPGFDIYNYLITEDDIYKTCQNDYEKQFLKNKPHLGYFSWKPRLIKKTLEKINVDDILIYSDVMDIIHPAILPKLKNYKFTDLILLNGTYTNSYYTKQDCFDIMGCSSKKYYNSIQLEAGFSLWKKTQFSMSLLEEWERYCFNLYANGEDENLSGKVNAKEYVAHRWDQSILTNLKIKYQIPIFDADIRNYIECNVDFFLKKNLKVSLLHNMVQKFIIEKKSEFEFLNY